MQFKDDFLDEMGDVAVAWATHGDGPLMGVSFRDTFRRGFDVG